MGTKVSLARWEPDVTEARRRGVSLKAYAKERGLSAHSMYAASQEIARRDRKVEGRSAKAAFVAVKVTPSRVDPMLVARLPNGVVLEVACGDSDGAVMASLVTALGALRCSG